MKMLVYLVYDLSEKLESVLLLPNVYWLAPQLEA